MQYERTLMKLTGRTILITGGSAGIGLAFALKFLELGNEVIVTGRRQAALGQVMSKYPKLHTILDAVLALAAVVVESKDLGSATGAIGNQEAQVGSGGRVFGLVA